MTTFADNLPVRSVGIGGSAGQARSAHAIEISRHSGGISFEEARQAAMELVSTALVKPVLASLRENPLGPETGPFAQNAVDRRFGPLLDEHLADAVTSSSNFSLIDAIVERYMPHTTQQMGLDIQA